MNNKKNISRHICAYNINTYIRITSYVYMYYVHICTRTICLNFVCTCNTRIIMCIKMTICDLYGLWALCVLRMLIRAYLSSAHQNRMHIIYHRVIQQHRLHNIYHQTNTNTNLPLLIFDVCNIIPTQRKLIRGVILI